MGSKKSGRYKLAYTPELHAAIVKSLRHGAYQVHAANGAGISITTLQRWVKLGRNGVEPYVRFAEDVDRARAEDALRNQAIISAAALKDWKAAAWLLERKFPKLYGRRPAMDNVDDLPPPAEGDDDTTVHSPWLNLQ
jgi:hypothetical protein